MHIRRPASLPSRILFFSLVSLCFVSVVCICLYIHEGNEIRDGAALCSLRRSGLEIFRNGASCAIKALSRGESFMANATVRGSREDFAFQGFVQLGGGGGGGERGSAEDCKTLE